MTILFYFAILVSFMGQQTRDQEKSPRNISTQYFNAFFFLHFDTLDLAHGPSAKRISSIYISALSINLDYLHISQSCCQLFIQKKTLCKQKMFALWALALMEKSNIKIYWSLEYFRKDAPGGGWRTG